MKYLYKLLSVLMVSLFVVGSVQAQETPQEIMVRDLNSYAAPLTSQDDIPLHPLNGELVTFDAVIVSYPKNSGLATPNKGPSGAEPGRIHLFVTDVNAIDEGEDGMSMQIVVEGSQMRNLETYIPGDVISVTGMLDNFNSTMQFNATDVQLLGDVETSPQYQDLAPLLEPEVIELSEINQPSENGDSHRWVAEGYSKYAHRYIKLEGLEVIYSHVENGRPYMLLSDGETYISTNDMSLRYRNDRELYGFKVEEDGGEKDTVLSLGYNYRRPEIDGDFTPPPGGSVVDISGYYLVNPSYDPQDVDESFPQGIIRIIPWSDGIRWTADGTDTEYRLTEDIPNDFEVLGFSPSLENFTVTPDSGVANDDQVEVSIDVFKPEVDYTLDKVEISYTSYPYTAHSGDTTTVGMTQNGDTYSYTFDSFDDFTTVKYTISATTTTPGGIETTATKDSLFYVESSTQTAPVVFSEPSGTYENIVEVSLSSYTPGADIYYTLDGSEPDANSEKYTSPFILDVPDSTTNIKAIAIADGMDASPVLEHSYTVVLSAIEVSTIADLRGVLTGTPVQFTGEAVVTFTQDYRNQRYIQDETGGVLIDDSQGNITSSYGPGALIGGLVGELTVFSDVLQFVPYSDPGESTGTAEITPAEVTLSELDVNVHESMLVTISDVTFVDAEGNFGTGTSYPITDGSLAGDETVSFYTAFYDADYIETAVPTGTVKLTALVGDISGNPELTARNSGDIEITTSIERDGMPQEFALEHNYPNPFNPTTVIQYSLANHSNVKLQVFDILGREVATLVNEAQAAGVYTINFDAKALSSGTYFYRIKAGDFTSIRKMMLIK